MMTRQALERRSKLFARKRIDIEVLHAACRDAADHVAAVYSAIHENRGDAALVHVLSDGNQKYAAHRDQISRLVKDSRKVVIASNAVFLSGKRSNYELWDRNTDDRP